MAASNQILCAFKKIYISAPVAYLALLIVGIVIPQAWLYLFSVFFAFVLSDLILNTVIHGGKGHAKIFGDNAFVDKGYAYLVCLLGIILGTLVSEFVASSLMSWLTAIIPWYQALLITNLIASAAVVADLEWRFYKKK